AADRVIIAFGQKFVVLGVRAEAHAVDVVGQLLALVEDEVGFLVERDVVAAVEAQATGRADAFEARGNRIRIDAVRPFALEPAQHRLVGAVAAAGQRERAVQFAAHAAHAIEHARLGEPALAETRRRPHRPDGMRGRRADSYLEQVEDTYRHARTASGRDRVAVVLSGSRSIDRDYSTRPFHARRHPQVLP